MGESLTALTLPNGATLATGDVLIPQRDFSIGELDLDAGAAYPVTALTRRPDNTSRTIEVELGHVAVGLFADECLYRRLKIGDLLIGDSA